MGKKSIVLTEKEIHNPMDENKELRKEFFTYDQLILGNLQRIYKM
jgi:hypothetical protein